MRGRTKLVSSVAILAVILVSSMAFASGIMNTSRMPLFYMPMDEPQADGGNVFVDPAAVIKDYVNNPGYQIGNVFPVHVNITGVTVGIYTYAVNLTWNPDVLNFSRIISYGNFLYQTASPYGTSRNELISFANNTRGTASIAETILGNYPGVTGQGRLFTAEFKVVGYGCSNLVIDSGTGTGLPTRLLDASGASLAFTKTDGYFKNKIFGDSNGDGLVTAADVGTLSDYWTGPPPGLYAYNRDIDQIDDGVVTAADVGVVSDNWLRSVP